jgi:hypothetical protein
MLKDGNLEPAETLTQPDFVLALAIEAHRRGGGLGARS